MDSFYTEEQFISYYENLVQIYNTQKDKLLPKIREVFRYQYTDYPIVVKTGYYKNLYKLKVALETQFMRDVKCNYKYILLATPNSVGCDFRELIFNLEKKIFRESFLENIKKASHYLIKNIINKKINHILTDIDDTLYPSKSVFSQTSGRDSSWKNHEPYPGIRKFYKLFYSTLPEDARYTTVLTGSPLFLKETLIDDPKISSIIGPNFGFIQGSERKRDAVQTLLTGMVDRPFYYLAPSAERVGQEKFNRFKQYAQIFPEYRLFFIGDNGQGDLIAGKRMLQDQPDCIVCIHNIIYQGKFLFTYKEEQMHKIDNTDRLFFFKNYLELAYIFTHVLNIFTISQYEEFKEATIVDLKSGLENIIKPSKNLYTHYLSSDNSYGKSYNKENDLTLKQKIIKRKNYTYKTQKSPVIEFKNRKELS